MPRRYGYLVAAAVALAGCAAQPLSPRERTSFASTALGGGTATRDAPLLDDDAHSQTRRDEEAAAEIAAHEREIRRQRAEIDAIRRRQAADGYDGSFDRDQYDDYDDPRFDDRY